MHDIWNPWHGCVKCSEGCQHCYMYFLDRMHDRNGADIYRTGSGFRYPLQKDRNGRYKIQSGELIRVCMSSDFFLEQADEWRDECAAHDVTFCFVETGTNFIKDGKQYHMPKKQLQSEMAFKSSINYAGKPMVYKLTDHFGQEIPKEKLYVPHYRKNCETCGSQPICNGCSDCGRCKS